MALWSLAKTCLAPAIMLAVSLFVRNGWALNAINAAVTGIVANGALIATWLGSVVLILGADLRRHRKAKGPPK